MAKDIVDEMLDQWARERPELDASPLSVAVRVQMLGRRFRRDAERSLTEIFHYWFDRGSPWHSTKNSSFGPAPGYLVGGPNARYSGPLSPPAGQPPQKSYKDWHGPSKERPWEMTEPHIVYQAAYIKLLSKFVGRQQ